MKIIFKDFTANFGDNRFLKLKIGNEILHEHSNVKGARVVSFAI